jgi:hypothetical protein
VFQANSPDRPPKKRKGGKVPHAQSYNRNSDFCSKPGALTFQERMGMIGLSSGLLRSVVSTRQFCFR